MGNHDPHAHEAGRKFAEMATFLFNLGLGKRPIERAPGLDLQKTFGRQACGQHHGVDIAVINPSPVAPMNRVGPEVLNSLGKQAS